MKLWLLELLELLRLWSKCFNASAGARQTKTLQEGAKMNRTAAIIGSGTIGGGWAARFLIMGWDVVIYDPSDGAEEAFKEMLTNARRSLPGLSDVMLPKEGHLLFSSSLKDAVENADWIQESVPERLELKHDVLSQIQSCCREEAIIASSTSGFRPTQLQESSIRPQQVIVAHPFNPVYLFRWLSW